MSRAEAQTLCHHPAIPDVVVETIIKAESTGNPLALGAMVGKKHVSFFPEDADNAATLLRQLLTLTSNVDIGLMQINYKWHVKDTGIDPATLLDPLTNLKTGCRILSQALGETGDMVSAMERYHSRTATHQRAYLEKIRKAVRHE